MTGLHNGNNATALPVDVKNPLFLCHVLKNNVKKTKLVAG